MKTKTKWKDNPGNGGKYLQTKQLKRINLQNIQTPHLTLCQKKWHNEEMGRRSL